MKQPYANQPCYRSPAGKKVRFEVETDDGKERKLSSSRKNEEDEDDPVDSCRAGVISSSVIITSGRMRALSTLEVSAESNQYERGRRFKHPSSPCARNRECYGCTPRSTPPAHVSRTRICCKTIRSLPAGKTDSIMICPAYATWHPLTGNCFSRPANPASRDKVLPRPTAPSFSPRLQASSTVVIPTP